MLNTVRKSLVLLRGEVKLLNCPPLLNYYNTYPLDTYGIFKSNYFNGFKRITHNLGGNASLIYNEKIN